LLPKKKEEKIPLPLRKIEVKSRESGGKGVTVWKSSSKGGDAKKAPKIHFSGRNDSALRRDRSTSEGEESHSCRRPHKDEGQTLSGSPNRGPPSIAYPSAKK